MSNTITYITDFETALQSRLAHPQTWKDVCDVTYSDANVIRSSSISTLPSITTVTRDTALALQNISETSDTLNISTGRDLGIGVDLADLAQSPWTKPVELFDRIGQLLNEFIESNVLAQHGSFTNFGAGDLANTSTADTTAITITASNIDDVIRAVKRTLRVNNGQSFMTSNGVFFDWRPADFELLEAFTQANGFMQADKALEDGTVSGLHYLGADHYFTNDYTAGHVFCGVKKLQRLGILRGTYGQAHVIPFPAGSTNNFLSGNAYYSRVDIGHLTPTGYLPLIIDLNVA